MSKSFSLWQWDTASLQDPDLLHLLRWRLRQSEPPERSAETLSERLKRLARAVGLFSTSLLFFLGGSLARRRGADLLIQALRARRPAVAPDARERSWLALSGCLLDAMALRQLLSLSRLGMDGLPPDLAWLASERSTGSPALDIPVWRDRILSQWRRALEHQAAYRRAQPLPMDPSAPSEKGLASVEPLDFTPSFESIALRVMRLVQEIPELSLDSQELSANLEAFELLSVSVDPDPSPAQSPASRPRRL